VIFRHLGVAAGVAAAVLRPALARAEEQPLELEWTAPEGCPTRADVLARVLSLLASKEAKGGRADTRAIVRGVVTRSGGETLLRLETRVTRAPQSAGAASSGTLPGTRHLAGATCDEVTAAGTLVIALAIDPDATGGNAAGAPATEATSTPESSPPEPPPAASAATLPVAVEPTPSGERGVVPSEEPRGTRAYAVAGALLDVGTLPGPALGFRAGAGLSLARVRVELGVGYLLPRFAQADDSSGGAHVSLFAGHVRGCYGLVPGRISVEGCLGTEVGALIAGGDGFDRTMTVASPWLAVEASTGIAFAIAEGLSLGASAGALVPFGRSTIRSAESRQDARTYTELHQPSPVSFRLGLGLSFLFR
jgi:hypothetical protein